MTAEQLSYRSWRLYLAERLSEAAATDQARGHRVSFLGNSRPSDSSYLLSYLLVSLSLSRSTSGIA